MKKIAFLFLVLAVTLGLLSGCQANEPKDTQHNEQPPSPTLEAKLDESEPTPEAPSQPTGIVPMAPSREEYQLRDDLSVEALLAEYHEGSWNGSYSLQSRDDKKVVKLNDEGYLEYRCEGIIFYHSDAMEHLFGAVDDGVKVEDWNNSKVYVDLPEHTLPEDVWMTAYTLNEGTYVLDQHGVTLYRDEELLMNWEIDLGVDSSGGEIMVALMAPAMNPIKGSPNELAPVQLNIGSKIFQLNSDGTTSPSLENVLDLYYYGAVPFISALTLSEDGVLTMWDYGYDLNPVWQGLEVANEVAEARYGCNSVIYRTGDGLAYVVLKSQPSYEPAESCSLCLGSHQLDELDELWEKWLSVEGSPIVLNEALYDFAEQYCGQAT